MRVVVDTNVWVSAIITPSSYSGTIIGFLEAEAFEPVVCEETIEELRSTLSKRHIVRRLTLQQDLMHWLVGLLASWGQKFEDVEIAPVSRDPTDDIFIALAVAADADYLVTRDDDLKGDPAVRDYLAARGVELVTVREFVDVLEALP